MHTYEKNSDGMFSVHFIEPDDSRFLIKRFSDEAAAAAFVNFLNGGGDDGWSTAKSLLRRGEDK